MSAEFLIDMIMNTASKLYKIFALKKRLERIRIDNGSLTAVNTLNDKFLFKFLDIRNGHSVESGLIGKLHLICLLLIVDINTDR